VTRPALRGVTLLELLIALGLSSLLVVAGTGLLLGQQRAFNASSGQRAVQESGRLALEEVARSLRGAGYGVDPALVFDFGEMASVPRSRLGAYGRGYNLSWACTAAHGLSWAGNQPVRCRDSEVGSDEAVFYARDPMFSRPIFSATAGTLLLQGDLRQPLFAGQVLVAMCLLDPMVRAYVTVGRFTPGTDNPVAANLVQVQLAPGRTVNAVPAFPFENEVLSDACFGAGAAVVARVDRYRYFVDTFDEAGNRVAPQTPGSRPYLMLDQGLLDQNGANIVVPVAADVEDLQFTWLYPPAAAGAGARLVGATPGVNAADGAFPIDVTVPPPASGAPPGSAARVTGNPTNIQGARVSVVVRSAEPDISLTDDVVRTIPAAGNRPAVLGLPYYRRTLFETTVIVRNLQGQAFVYTTVDPTGQPGMNLGGG